MDELLKARRRYRAMMDALSGKNPVDLTLRRDLEAAIARIDARLSAESAGGNPPHSLELNVRADC